MTPIPPPLNCTIIGAGIAGLAAGIALRKSGHTVTIYEKSRFKNEIGAAISMTPNGNRVLAHWNFDFEKAKETDKQVSRQVDSETLGVTREVDLRHIEDTYGYKFSAFHRVDLHQGLRKLAEEAGARIVLGREVVGLDEETGEVKFRDGGEERYDLVIVADGIRSSFVKAISGSNAALIKTGRSVFRGLVPMEKLLNDPLVRPVFENQPSGFYATVSTSGIFLMTYPCRNNEIMNVGVFHPTREGHEEDEGWNTPASLEEVLSVMGGLHPMWKRLVTHGGDGWNCFPVAVREVLPRYNKGRAVLIGDAAHSMMPTFAQGGCLSLEDAAALGIFFPPDFDVEKESIAQRLQLFNDFRLPRDNTGQLYSNLRMPNVNEKVKMQEAFETNVRRFYAGPLMSSKDSGQLFDTGSQAFFYNYDVFEQARRAMEIKDREAGLMQEEVKHFF